MSAERRFIVKEVFGPTLAQLETLWPEVSITESELKHRLQCIVDRGLGESIGYVGNMGQLIDILLNGEGKEPEDFSEHAPCPDCFRTVGHLLGCPKSNSRREYNEPPTDEWEEWVQRMPRPTADYFMPEWWKDMQQWFREMPR